MTISHTHPWSAQTNRVTGIADEEIDEADDFTGDTIVPAGDTDCDVTLTYQYADAAPTAGSPIQLYIMESDGASFDAVKGRFITQLPAIADQTARPVTVTQIPIGPNSFKWRIANLDPAQKLTVTLTCRTYRAATQPVA